MDADRQREKCDKLQVANYQIIESSTKMPYKIKVLERKR